MEAVNNPEIRRRHTPIEFGRGTVDRTRRLHGRCPEKKYFRDSGTKCVHEKRIHREMHGLQEDDSGSVGGGILRNAPDPDNKTGMPGGNPQNQRYHPLVSCAHCLPAEVRLYDRLWKVENLRDEMAAIREAKNCDALEAMKEMINPDSLECINQLLCREISGRCQTAGLLAVPAHRLFQCRQRLYTGTSGVQPHRIFKRYLEQNQ